MIAHFRSRLVVKLSLLILSVLLILSGALIYMQIQNTKKASVEAIGNFSIHMAEAYAGQFNLKSYEAFLQEKKENDLYWSLREEMNQYRQKIGALYVYTVQIDDQKKPLLLIDGQPKDSDSASPIGEVTDMPAEAIDSVLKGGTAKSDIIHNAEYGNYISSYAPLRDASGKVIGVLGIDTDVSVSDSIYRDVLAKSTPLFVMMGVLTLLVFLVIVWFMRRALRPLGTIVSGAEAVAQGNLAVAKQRLGAARVKSKDEIGQAYNAMNKMAEKLGVLLGDVVHDMAASTQTLVHSTEQFSSETDRMVSLNVQLERAITELADGAQHQRLGAEESAKSLEEITYAIQRISEASANVSGASGEALETAEQGRSSIRQLREQVVFIADAAEQTTHSVEVLNTYMQEIEPVLQSIITVADQTKLLALNASIEAARAGEHGAGFAVVAGEIRKLADSSSSATQHITSLLEQIQQESAHIGHRMLEGSGEMVKGKELSNQMESFYNGTMDRFNLVNNRIQEISAAAQEVLAGSEEAAASVEEISQISHAAADNTAEIQRMASRQLEAAKRIADTTELLRRSSSGLEEAIGKFNL